MTPFIDNSQKFNTLRKNYPIFKYKNYGYTFNKDKSSIILNFEFECKEHKFNPKIEFLVNKLFVHNRFDSEEIAIIAFNIGMIELISYWKAFACPIVLIEAGYLTAKQIKFWKKQYFNGLGEYFYLNSIQTNIDDFMTIVPKGPIFDNLKFKNQGNENKVIVPIGGGKDSVVTLELLRNNGFEILPMIINPRGATTNCVEVGGFTKGDYLSIKRTIDKHLLELNDKGYLNGHTPFSAMLAFVSLFCAFVTNTRNIALSNENSANESTVIGENVNHQYSKSIEFEADFRNYVKEFIYDDFNYFSFLRPMSELQIAQQFSLLSQYHEVFRSCNAGSKTDVWCCNCPKCLFAYIILSPFLFPNKLENHFGENLLNKKSLKTYLDELIGKLAVKPFECVGTVEEVNLAIALLVERYPQSKEFYLVDYWLSLPLAQAYCSIDKEEYLYEFSPNHFLEKRFQNVLSNPYAMFKKAEIARQLGDNKIVIFGFGKEGQSTFRLLRKLFPNKLIGLQDNNPKIRDIEGLSEELNDKILKFHVGDDASYSQEYDLVIKSPGIALNKMTRTYNEQQITSQTDIFLQQYAHQCIGVTGTKGKSTTSTLIYKILKEKHEDVLLAGNIGVPMLDLIDQITPNTIIVLELSAHQLQFIKKAPKVSVLLNLYQEHLDHFQTYEQYQEAKLNILKYQDENNNAFLYNSNDKLIGEWIDKLQKKTSLIPIDIKDYSFPEPTTLKGEHNKFNIMIAYNVAKFLGKESEEGLKSIIEFNGLEHRLQFVCERDEVTYYNDSISTIPQATLAALRSLKNVQTLILGGKDRGIDYSILKNILFEFEDLKNIVFVSEAGKRISKIIIENNSKDINYLFSNNFDEIVTWCKTKTQKGKKVLLSPAAASYDMFKNFEERGNTFMYLVNQD
ncbi:MAG: UDP-N-acetylmuramoyl-L-alanine--D-glutamate ligase [Bacteroidales bacterium]|nr:UDP-N-acetylmuramoyl-L-alanine--D-glutamate ligase [Bacteroidales bacterium]